MDNLARLDREAARPLEFDVAMPYRGDGVANALRDVYDRVDRRSPDDFVELLTRLDKRTAPTTAPC